MLDLVLSLLAGSSSANLRSLARRAVFAALTLAFALLALAAGSIALFLALEEALGPLRAALVVGAGAAGLALLASIPLWRRSKPPPSSQMATLVELAIAVGLALLSERKPKA